MNKIKKYISINIIVFCVSTQLLPPQEHRTAKVAQTSLSEVRPLSCLSPQTLFAKMPNMPLLGAAIHKEHVLATTGSPFALTTSRDIHTFGKVDHPFFTQHDSSLSWRKRLSMWAYRLGYYSGYFASSLIFDMVAITFFFTLLTSGILQLSFTVLIIALILYSIVRIALGVCDALATEYTKNTLKKSKDDYIWKVERGQAVLPFQEHLQQQRDKLDPVVYSVLWSLSKNLLKPRHKALLNPLKILQWVDKESEHQQLSLNQKLFVLNSIHIHFFHGRDINHFLSSNPSASEITTMLTGDLSLIERTLLINAYALQALSAPDIGLQRLFVTTLIEEHFSRANVKNFSEIFYRKELENLFAYLFFNNICLPELKNYLARIGSDDGATYHLRSLLHALSILPTWPEELKIFVQNTPSINLIWRTYLAVLHKESAPNLLKLFHQATDIANKRILASVLAQAQDHIGHYNESVLQALIADISTLSNPRNDTTLNSYALAVLTSVTQAFLKGSGKSTATLEDKQKSIAILETFLHTSQARQHFQGIWDDVEALLQSVKANGYNNPIFVQNSKTSAPATPLPHEKWSLKSKQLFYFNIFYGLSSAILIGLILYPLFNLPLISLPIMTIVISIIYALCFGLLQVFKGISRFHSYYYTLKAVASLKNNAALWAQLKKLQTNILFRAKPLSYQQEDFIYQAFTAAQSTYSTYAWQSFYTQAIAAHPEGRKLSRILAIFAFELDQKPYLLSMPDELNTTISAIMKQYLLPLSQRTHFYNIIHPQYIISAEKMFPHNDSHMAHFEIDALRVERMDVIYRFKYLAQLATIYYDTRIDTATQSRIFLFFLNNIKNHFTMNMSDNATVQQMHLFIAQDILRNAPEQDWLNAINLLIRDARHNQALQGAYYMPAVKDIAFSTQQVDHMLALFEQSSNEEKKIILYLLSNMHNLNSSSQNRPLLPTFFYKRFGNYSVFFLIAFILTIFILDFIFRFNGLLAITTSSFIVPLLLLNIISLIGRMEKDVVESTFENKHIYADILNKKVINIRLLQHKEIYRSFLKANDQYKQWKVYNPTAPYPAKKEQLFQYFATCV